MICGNTGMRTLLYDGMLCYTILLPIEIDIDLAQLIRRVEMCVE